MRRLACLTPCCGGLRADREEKRVAHGTDRSNITLVLLPPYSPELNPVERVWLYLRERFLSLRFLDDTEAIIEACCFAQRVPVHPHRARQHRRRVGCALCAHR